MRRAALFDMDGTLADVSGIRHYVRGPRKSKDFDSFHALSVDCPPHQWVVEMARGFSNQGIDVVIVTARKAKWRGPTAWFLAQNDVPSAALFMRADKDGRPDVEVKRDILAAIRRTWVPVVAVDDNPSVIALWKSEGIPTIIVPGWEA